MSPYRLQSLRFLEDGAPATPAGRAGSGPSQRERELEQALAGARQDLVAKEELVAHTWHRLQTAQDELIRFRAREARWEAEAGRLKEENARLERRVQELQASTSGAASDALAFPATAEPPSAVLATPATAPGAATQPQPSAAKELFQRWGLGGRLAADGGGGEVQLGAKELLAAQAAADADDEEEGNKAIGLAMGAEYLKGEMQSTIDGQKRQIRVLEEQLEEALALGTPFGPGAGPARAPAATATPLALQVAAPGTAGLPSVTRARSRFKETQSAIKAAFGHLNAELEDITSLVETTGLDFQRAGGGGAPAAEAGAAQAKTQEVTYLSETVSSQNKRASEREDPEAVVT